MSVRPHNEIIFENDIIKDLTSTPESEFSKPYLEGKPENYNASLGRHWVIAPLMASGVEMPAVSGVEP